MYNVRFDLARILRPVRLISIFADTDLQEDEELFARTMRGVMANIEHLNNRDRSPTWSQDGWKKVRQHVN